MLTTIFIGFFIINFFFVLIRKKPFILLPVNIIFVVILVYGTTKTGDYAIYELMYTTGYSRNTIEVGYNFWTDVCNALGMTFNQFWLSLVIIFGAVILWVFSKFSNNYPLFFSLYYIHMIFIDIVQIRTFCVGSIFTLAIYFLFQGKRKIYMLLLLLAVSFHIQILFFAPLVFFDFTKQLTIKFIKWSGGIMLGLCAFLFLIGNKMTFIANMGISLISSLGSDTKTVYFNTTTRFGFLLYFALHLGAIAVTYYCRSKVRDSQSHNEVIDFCNKCLTLQMYCIFCFPLIMINMNFYRLYRVIYIVNYISWAMILDSMKTTRQYYKSVFAIFAATLLYRLPLVHGNNQIEIILNNNKFFD